MAPRQLSGYMGGDPTIIEEVCAARRLQDELAAQRPDDPRRAFGQAVEASGSVGVVDALADVLNKALGTMSERLLGEIDARFEQQAKIQEQALRELTESFRELSLRVLSLRELNRIES